MAKVKCIFCSSVLMIPENVIACKKNTFQVKFDSAGNNVSLFTGHMSFQIFLLVEHLEKVKNSSPKSLSANCWPAVYQQLTDSWPTANRHLKIWQVWWHRRHSTLIVLLESVAWYTTNWAKIASLYSMSSVSLYMKSPFYALRFVLARHICSFNYLCLFEFIFG